MENIFEKVTNNVNGSCIPLLNANSQGIFKRFSDSNVPMEMESKLPLMHLRLVLIFITTQLFRIPFKRFGFAPLVSQIVAGIILSPSALGSTKLLKKILSPQPMPDTFFVLLQVSFGFFLFLYGVKVDLSITFRTGKKAWVFGIISFLAPVMAGFTYASSTSLPPWKFYVVALQLCSSFSVISSLIHDLKLVNTEFGRLGLSAAFINDICNVCLITLIIGAQRYTLRTAITSCGIFLMYLLFLFFVVRPGMMWIIRQTPEGKPVKGVYVQLIVGGMLASSLVTQIYAYQMYLGAYFFGLIVPDGPPLGSAVVEKAGNLTIDILLPLLTSHCIILADPISTFTESIFTEVQMFCIFVILVVFLSKSMVSVLVLLCCKLPFNHALALALIISYQGIFELNAIALSVYFQYLPKEVSSILSISILLNTSIFPNILRLLYNPSKRHAGYQKRNIADLKHNSELKILACIHRPQDISAIKCLFDICQPTTESPITAYVLHLVELQGRISPIFVSHQLQKKSHSEKSYSAAIVRSFEQYRLDSCGAVSMNIFTAVTPLNVMHEDICTLALDKVTSLIVLPFHQKWSLNGFLESDSRTIRSLNCNILERAPCSVGILVDHNHIRDLESKSISKYSYNIGMIFTGGEDDWEALTLARRMAQGPEVCLTIVNFNLASDNPDADWNKKLVDVMMKEIKLDSLKMKNLRYIEEHVSDAIEMALRIKPMVDEFDIFIVGRRHNSKCPATQGLNEWSEFPELGIIGDLLTSAEFNIRASVLILQQQDRS